MQTSLHYRLERMVAMGKRFEYDGHVFKLAGKLVRPLHCWGEVNESVAILKAENWSHMIFQLQGACTEPLPYVSGPNQLSDIQQRIRDLQFVEFLVLHSDAPFDIVFN